MLNNNRSNAEQWQICTKYTGVKDSREGISQMTPDERLEPVNYPCRIRKWQDQE